MEVRLAFDRAVDPALAAQMVGREIRFGEGEKPGKVGRAGGDQGTLKVAAARLADDGRTLILVTDPHPREATYRLTLPGSKTEVPYNLGGVEVVLNQDGKKWAGWWPVIDPAEARRITAGSAEHDRLWNLTLGNGNLTLQTLVSASDPNVTATLDAPVPFEATFGTDTVKLEARQPAAYQATLKAEATGEPIYLSIGFANLGALPTTVRASIGGQPIARSAFVLPWAPPAPVAAAESVIPPQFLTGGDPVRGATVFFSEQAKCANCHQAEENGKGGIIGPNLASLAGRDRGWVYQNIIEPSASLHPIYVSYTVAMKDGRIAMGVVRADGADAVKVSDIEAKVTAIPRAEIEEIRPSSSSIMPVGLLGAIGEDNTRDLLAYLTAPRPKPPEK